MTGRDLPADSLNWRQVEILSAVLHGIPIRRYGDGYVAENRRGLVSVRSVDVDGLVAGGWLSVGDDGRMNITESGIDAFNRHLGRTIAEAQAIIRSGGGFLDDDDTEADGSTTPK